MQNDLISRSALSEELSSLTMTITGLRAGKGVLRECMTEYQKSVLRIVDDAPAVDAVVLPCKIGDTVWAVRRISGGHLRAFQSVVSEMQFLGSEMRLSITVRGVCRGEWGKTIFATKEEAEEVKRRNDHEH